MTDPQAPLRAALLLTLGLAGCTTPDADVDPPRTSSPDRDERLTATEGFAGLGVNVLPPLGGSSPVAAELRSLSSRGASLEELLLALFGDSDLNLLLEAESSQSVSVELGGASLAETFEALLDHFDLAAVCEGSFVRIVDHERRVFDVDFPSGGGGGGGGGEAGGDEGAGGGGGGSEGGGDEGGGGDSAGTGGSGGGGTSSAEQFWSGLEGDLEQLTESDPDALLVVNADLGTVMVESRPSVLARVQEFLSAVGKRASRQVSIEAHVLEVQLRKEFRAGVDFNLLPGFLGADPTRWTGLTQNGGIFEQSAQSNSDTFQAGFLKNGDFSVFVDALEGQGQVRVISSPRISTLHNVPALIRVVEQVPVIERQIVDTLNGTRTEYSVRFEDAGVVVQVTPFVGEDGMITAEIEPAITEVSGFITTPDGLVSEPILNTRTVHTLLRVRDGQPIVLGGLRGQDTSEELRKTPILGDLPLLGPLFRQTIQSSRDTELVILLFPRVLTPEWERADVERGISRVVQLERPYAWSTLDMQRPSDDWGQPALDRRQGSRATPAPAPGRITDDTPRDASAPADPRRGAGLDRSELARFVTGRALTALEAGHATAARTDLRSALSLDPGNADTWTLLALTELRRGTRKAARDALRKAITNDPLHGAAHNNLALLELQAGQPRAALAILEGLPDEVRSGALENTRGMALRVLDRREEATAAFESAIERSAKLPEPHLNLALCRLEQGQPAEAIEHYAIYLARGGSTDAPAMGPISRIFARLDARLQIADEAPFPFFPDGR